MEAEFAFDKPFNMEDLLVPLRMSALFAARTELIRDIKNVLDETRIEIPFPHRTVYFGNRG